jgi:hypothetical protein
MTYTDGLKRAVEILDISNELEMSDQPDEYVRAIIEAKQLILDEIEMIEQGMQ